MKYFRKKQLLPIPEEASSPEVSEVFRDVYYRGTTFSGQQGQSTRRPGLHRKLFVILPFFVLALVTTTVAGFYLFVRNPDIKFGEEMVSLTMTLPSSVAAGAPFTASIHYENRGAISLESAVLNIVPSAGFVPDTPHTGLEWLFPLGTLDPFTQGARELPGILLRQAGTEGTWRAVLTFKPSGFGATFRKSSFATVRILPPVFTTSIDTPAYANPGKPYSFTARIKNPQGHALPNLGVLFTLPQGVTLESVDPETIPSAVGSFLWTIESIPLGASWEGTATLMLPADLVASSVLRITVGTTSGSELITLEEQSIPLGVPASSGNIELQVNSATTAHTIDFSDPLHATVTITNPQDHDINNLSLQMEVGEHGASFLDWDHIKSAGAVQPISANQTSGKITHFVVNSSRFSGFSLVKPGKKVTFAFTVPILMSAYVPPPSAGSMLSATSEATVSYQDGGKEVVMVSNPVVTTLNSNLTLARTAQYVDATHTRVRISLVMKNTMHELSALSLDLALGSPSVRVDTQGVDAGEIHASETGRRVTWSLNRFPTTVQEIKGFVDLVVTPVSQEVGKAIVLIDSSSLSAVDEATGGIIRISQGALSL